MSRDLDAGAEMSNAAASKALENAARPYALKDHLIQLATNKRFISTGEKHVFRQPDKTCESKSVPAQAETEAENALTSTFAEGLELFSNDDLFLMSVPKFSELAEFMTGYQFINNVRKDFNTAYKAELSRRCTESEKKLESLFKDAIASLDYANTTTMDTIDAFLFIRKIEFDYVKPDKAVFKRLCSGKQIFNLPQDIKNYLDSSGDLAISESYNKLIAARTTELLATAATNTVQSASSAAAASASASSSSSLSPQTTMPEASDITALNAAAAASTTSSSSSTSVAFTGHDGFFNQAAETNRTGWLQSTLDTLNKKTFAPTIQWVNDAYFIRLKNDVIDSAIKKITIELKAETSNNSSISDNITLTRQDSTDQKTNAPIATWTCTADFKESLTPEDQEKRRFQLIAMESLALRQAQNLREADQIGIVALNPEVNEKRNINFTAYFTTSAQTNRQLSLREVALIQAHFDAGYTTVSYDNVLVTRKITPNPITTLTYKQVPTTTTPTTTSSRSSSRNNSN